MNPARSSAGRLESGDARDAGRTLAIRPGGQVAIDMDRENIAERLYLTLDRPRLGLPLTLSFDLSAES